MNQLENIYFKEYNSKEDKYTQVTSNSLFFPVLNHVQLEVFQRYSPSVRQKIIVLFVKMEQLFDTESIYSIYRNTNIYECKIENKINNDICPIITIGLEDIRGLIEEEDKPYVKITHKRLNISQKVKFFDSSIWNYYVPINNEFSENILAAFNYIDKLASFKIYKTNNALEFIEFNLRKLKENYLKSFGGGHAIFIDPFIFHSEQKMKYLVSRSVGKKHDKNSIQIDLDYLQNQNLTLFSNKNIGKVHWNILLIDDHAKRPLSPYDKKDSSETIKSNLQKINILKSVLENDNWYVDVNISKKNTEIEDYSKPTIYIDYASNINEAFEKISKSGYDILLLDYLLEYKDDDFKSRDTGIQFLTKLKKQETKNQITILNKIWVFPISAFSQTFIAKLREQGFGHLDSDWHFAYGADIINTPFLFRFNLYRFMKIQKKEAVGNLLDDENCRFFGFISRIYSGNSRSNAIEEFSNFIFLFTRAQELKFIKEKKNITLSPFEKTIYRFYFFDVSMEFLLTVRNLIYLTAFGTGLEWEEMWEDYSYLKRYFVTNNLFAKEAEEMVSNISLFIHELRKKFN